MKNRYYFNRLSNVYNFNNRFTFIGERDTHHISDFSFFRIFLNNTIISFRSKHSDRKQINKKTYKNFFLLDGDIDQME